MEWAWMTAVIFRRGPLPVPRPVRPPHAEMGADVPRHETGRVAASPWPRYGARSAVVVSGITPMPRPLGPLAGIAIGRPGFPAAPRNPPSEGATGPPACPDAPGEDPK